MLLCLRLSFLLPFFDFRAVPVPCIERLLRLFLGNAPILRKTMNSLAVRDTEVECFSLSAFTSEGVFDEWNSGLALGIVPLQQHTAGIDCLLDMRIHTHGRTTVEAAARCEGFNHTLAPSDMRQKTQLQLTVICDDQRVAFLCNESIANLVLVLLKRGLVL